MQSQSKTRSGRGGQWASFLTGGALLLWLVWCPTVLAEPAPSSLFPLPDALRPNVTFWKRVFAVFDSNGGVLHDMEDVTLVYHIWYNDLPTDPPLRQGIIDEARSRYRAILETLADGKRLYLTSDEERVWALFKGKQHALAFRAAANNIHFQSGMRSRFAQGLVRSWTYLPEIERIFADAGLPTALTLLPHIESSFENRAMSKVGAAGIWQIMPATGRRYLRVNGAVDERLDIRASTMAAAQILRENYAMLGTWPLAITAYNHGANGMKQAVATVGTTDFGVIVQRYRSPLFGFASQNFYAEFLAAIDLVQNYKHYFGDILFAEPPRPLTVMASTGAPLVSTPMPAPPPPSPGQPRPLVHRSPPVVSPSAPVTLPARGKAYRVRPGDSLFTIAQRHGTTVATLAAINGLNQRAGIRAGQTLLLSAPLQPVVRAAPAPQRGPVVPVVATVTTTPALPVQRAVLSTVTRVPAPSPVTTSGGAAPGIRLPELADRLHIKGDTIRVAAPEQLDQYAGWLAVPVQRLLTLNRLSARQSPALGAAVRLDFSRVSALQFTQRRLQYHRSLEEEFLRRYRIGAVVTRKLKPGETLLSVSRQVPGVPLWLLQRYNTHLGLHAPRPGAELRLPKVVSRVS